MKTSMAPSAPSEGPHTPPRREVRTACRICAGACGLRLEIDPDGAVSAVHGDRDDPMSRGYACLKGLQLPAAHASPQRLLQPLKRTAQGFTPIPLDQALDEIAGRIAALVAESGADAVGAFKGTMAYTNFLANALLPAFIRALGSSAFYSTMTIDQSAKWVTVERLGAWAAGKDAFETADVLMMVGTNPLVSLSTFNFALQNPAKAMRAAKARGLQLVVIDPRRSETARYADVFLQPRPGEDPTVLAGLLNLVFEHGWQDQAFCEAYAAGVAALRAAVRPFSGDYVARRAGVEPADLLAAARVFAAPHPDGRRKRGSAASGVGPNMAAHSNLAEHLLECLNVVCGRFARPGDRVPNPGVLGARHPRYAQVVAPRRGFDRAEGRSPSGYGLLFGERMSGALADDILSDAPNRLRALIVDGGNPASVLPESRRAVEALRRLDLLVTIDPFLTPTARLSDYVIPPTMMLERADVGSRDYENYVLFKPYGRYCPPALEPPAGAEVVDDWVVLWELARRLDLALTLDGERVPLAPRPSAEALIARLLRHSAVPFTELQASVEGRIFDVEPMRVEPGDPASPARFELAPADVLAELAAVLAEEGDAAGFRFAGRRMREVQNTMYHHLPAVEARTPFNAAYLHPEDMTELGLEPGGRVVLTSAHGRLEAVARPDPDLRRKTVALTHGWGGLPDEAGPEAGVNVNHLTSSRRGRDPLNAMPVLTGFAVRVEPAAAQSSHATQEAGSAA